VSSLVQATVLTVTAEAGAHVERGDPRIVLDDRELKARRQQAAEGLRSAEAARERAVQNREKARALLKRAQNNTKRIEELVAKNVETPDALELAETGLLQAKASVAESEAAIAVASAQVEGATEALKGADVALGHTKIVAPINTGSSDSRNSSIPTAILYGSSWSSCSKQVSRTSSAAPLPIEVSRAREPCRGSTRPASMGARMGVDSTSTRQRRRRVRNR